MGLQAVVREPAGRFRGHDAGVAQSSEVVGDIGLPRLELVDEVAGAQLLDGQQANDGRPGRVGEQPQCLGVEARGSLRSCGSSRRRPSLDFASPSE